MTDVMPRPLPQYVYAERSRHGRIAFYFRKGKGRRARLPDPGSPGFEDRYHALLSGLVTPKPLPRGMAGTLEWLIARYQETSLYHGFSPATRRQRDNILKGVIAKAGRVRFAAIGREHIESGRDYRAPTPAQSRHFLNTMRGLFRWAKEAGQVTTDPTEGVARLRAGKTDGFPAWTEAEVTAYEARWPEGTRERVWMHVILYTGLRRGDAVQIGRQHVKHGVATLKTEKTGTEVSITIRPGLARTLKAGPIGDLAFVTGARGEPLTKESFGNLFRAASRKAGVRKSAHGLRKLAASRAAEAGATVNELEAWFGWEGGSMASHYTRKADRKHLARQVADKMENAASPHLVDSRPAPEKTAI